MLIKDRDNTISVTVTNTSPVGPTNLTGKTALFRMWTPSGSDYVEIAGTIAAPTTGVVTALITQATLAQMQDTNSVQVALHLFNSNGTLFGTGKGPMEVSP